ncbi:MAG: hypothetical protein DRI90_14120 [Deltaproteobacteria bacterium]|nr:MAG: hypothetical protein DRI90_14120 [Deltaproteobacteria bacterium]
MVLLVVSILALAVGPLLLRVSGSRAGVLALFDGYVLVTLVGIVVLHVLPNAIALGGSWGAVAAAVGLIAPAMIERRLDEGGVVPRVLLWPAIAGLAIHALLDGAALVAEGSHGEHGHVSMLAVGVLLHRLPFGLTIWWVLRPRLGFQAGAALIVTMSVATVVGFTAATSVMDSMPLQAMAVFQALVAGSLLHVVVGHQPKPLREVTRQSRWLATAGAVLGAGTLIALAQEHPIARHVAGELAAGETFTNLALTSAPALLVGLAGGAVIWVFVSDRPTSWLARGGPLIRVGKGMVFGLPLPLSSCDVLPSYRRLVVAGAPLAAALAFLLATPQIGLEAAAMSLPLLGSQLAVARLVLAVAVALIVVALVAIASRGRVAARRDLETSPPLPSPGQRSHFVVTLRSALADRLDHIAPWMVTGFAVAALVEPLLDGRQLAAIPEGLDVLGMAIVGMVGYVPALGALPIAVVLLHKGLSAGAGIAFLITGPAVSMTTFAVLSSLHGRRVALVLGCGVALVATLAGLAINWLGSGYDIAALHAAAARGPNWLEWSSGVLIGALVLASLLRQGPRAALAKIFNPREHHDHHTDLRRAHSH